MALLEDYTVEIRPYRLKGKFKNWLRSFPKNFIRGIYNTYLLAKHRNMLQPLEKNQCPFKMIWTFTTPFFSGKMTSQPQIMKAVFKHARTDPEEGLFREMGTDRLFLFVLRDLFPKDTIAKNDFLFTAHKDFINQYRHPILRYLGQRNIQRHGDKIESIVKKTVASWASHPEPKLNISKLAFTFTSTTISSFLLDHPGPDEVFEEISHAVECLLSVMMKKAVWRKPLSKQEQADYNHSLQVFRTAVDTTLSLPPNPSSFIQMLKEEKDLTPLQIKGILFLMYFAGVDAPGSVLAYILWRLGKMPSYQDEIRAEIRAKFGAKQDSLYEIATQLHTVENLYAEGLRLFPPIYIVGRYPAKDLLCTVKDKAGNIILEEPLLKKQGIVNCPYFAARDPNLFPNPDLFDPHRYTTPLKTYPWLPFGDGQHLCPGQWISRAEITLFITHLVQNYTIHSFPDQEPPRKGFLTVQPETPFYLTLTPR